MSRKLTGGLGTTVYSVLKEYVTPDVSTHARTKQTTKLDAPQADLNPDLDVTSLPAGSRGSKRSLFYQRKPPSHVSNLSGLLEKKSVYEAPRKKQHSLCSKCGSLMCTAGFDNTPSAAIGMWSRCVDNTDFTHHKFVALGEADYTRLRPLSAAERISWLIDNGR